MPPSEQQATGELGLGMPYETALLEVIKGLHRDPILLFGIGAGILLVAVLATTSSVAVVLVVAAFFVVVLAARVHRQAQRVKRGADIGTTVVASSVEDSDIGNVPAGGTNRVRTRLGFSKVSGSRIGNVGGSPPPKAPED